jgi:acetolactate synthase small subunit
MAAPEDIREVRGVRAHIVWLEDRAGSLAELCRALGTREINISGISATTWEDRGAVAITTDDPDATTVVLEKILADHRAVELVAAALEDRPRALAEAAGRLAERGINIRAVVPMGVQDARRIIGFVVDVPTAARHALGDLALSDADL